jgi:hypothetical protein
MSKDVTWLRDPTIEDFADWVQFHLDKAIKSTHDACQVVERRNNAKGLLRSGNNIIECFDAAYGEFDKGVEAALGELRVAMVKGVLDKTLLRETVEMQMRQFALDMKHASKAPLFREWGLVPPRVLDEKEGEFDKKVQFALRHFDVGHLSPPEPEVPASMKNEIKIDQMIGSVIQQGTTGSNQTASVTINFVAVRNALDNLEMILSKHPAPPETAAEIEPEIQTIQAQLAKRMPSVTILREAGRSLRSISEGVAGGLLAPHVLTAIAALLSALGLQ